MASAKTGGFRPYDGPLLAGPRFVVRRVDAAYPALLQDASDPPAVLYGVGDPGALGDCLAVIGARRATPYGLACARRFSQMAVQRGIAVVSGGAFGCDSEAHRAALSTQGVTVAVLGGGCDQLYPARHHGLFQRIIDGGGAVVSEHEWGHPPLPWTFRARNRIIAGLARATLIVEAGLPSGTFSTADEALAAGRDVLAVPGAITSKTSAGSNRLISQGAVPIVDDESFDAALSDLFGLLRQQRAGESEAVDVRCDPLLAALQAEPMRIDQILERVDVPRGACGPRNAWIQMHLSELERDGLVARYPDGRYGPAKM